MASGEDGDRRKVNPKAPPRWAVMARRFYDQAVIDLEAARQSMRPRFYYVAVFLSTQAAEKGV